MPEGALADAPCKINLTLGVVGRRADGYHLLESVMQSLSLCDTVYVEKGGAGITLLCDDAALPADKTNTAWRAANAYLQAAGIREGVRVTVKKAIPYQAGLGSASADAAGTLAALNALYGALSPDALLVAAARVGADVPFCLTGGTQLAEGIGERMTAAPPLLPCTVLLCKPAQGVPTAAAFSRFDELTNPAQIDTRRMISALAAGDLAAVGRACSNALEPCCGCAEVFSLKSVLLSEGALGACMTGSGSAVFGIFPDEDDALAAQEKLARTAAWTFAARPVTHGAIIGK
jgi:4-diphosphocytidyl-2-C-methyl-D-erythritol kinase